MAFGLYYSFGNIDFEEGRLYNLPIGGNEEAYSQKYSVNKERIFVYKCGVNTNMFKLEADKKSVIRKQLGISDNSFVFVYVGGLMKWQKIEESLMIFADTQKSLMTVSS